MAKYSFKEECDNLDRLAREMRENLQKCELIASYRTVWKIAALAGRMKRKLSKYEDFIGMATNISAGPGVPVHIQKPLDENCGR
jgi:hypothetical protein